MNKYERVNHLYESSTAIQFIKLHNPVISSMIMKIKELKNTLYRAHPDDLLLHQQINQYISIIRKILTTLENYEDYLKQYLQEIKMILDNVGSVRNQVYLVQQYCEPIFEDVKELYRRKGNYYVERIEQLIKSYSPESIAIISKQKGNVMIDIQGKCIPIYHYKDSQLRALAQTVFIFIGSPDLFGDKFKTVFLAQQYVFMAFDIFNNELQRQHSFTTITTKDNCICTVYEGVNIEKGFKGVLATEVIQREPEQLVEVIQSRIESFEEDEDIFKTPSKLMRFTNGSWMLVPIKHTLNCLDLEENKIDKLEANKVTVGDFVIFRSNNERYVIREMADEILGEKARIYRKNIEIWKKQLVKLIREHGFEKVSKYFIKKGINTANIQNLKNWISPDAIAPLCLHELLIALKIPEDRALLLVNQAEKVRSRHKEAGRKIRALLMKELQQSMVIVDEIQIKGFYKFESQNLKGASFNIEEVRFISEKEYEVPISQTMILFRKDD